jgi:protein TonB
MGEKRERVKDESDRLSGAGSSATSPNSDAPQTRSRISSFSHSPDLWEDIHVHARKPSGLRTWALRAGVGAILLCFVGVLAYGAWSLLSGKESTKRQVVQISLLRPPPPPPPPQQKPPEPEVKQEVKAPKPEQPKQEEQAPPPGEQLGLDAKGSGSGDAFGLVAKQGGTDITKIGGPANHAQYAWFTGQVQTFLQDQLQKNDKLRKADYRVVMRLWFTKDGRIDHYELAGSTGNAEVDRYLQAAIGELPPLKQPPPADMPQPVKLRVTSRGAG